MEVLNDLELYVAVVADAQPVRWKGERSGPPANSTISIPTIPKHGHPKIWSLAPAQELRCGKPSARCLSGVNIKQAWPREQECDCTRIIKKPPEDTACVEHRNSLSTMLYRAATDIETHVFGTPKGLFEMGSAWNAPCGSARYRTAHFGEAEIRLTRLILIGTCRTRLATQGTMGVLVFVY